MFDIPPALWQSRENGKGIVHRPAVRVAETEVVAQAWRGNLLQRQVRGF